MQEQKKFYASIRALENKYDIKYDLQNNLLDIIELETLDNEESRCFEVPAKGPKGKYVCEIRVCRSGNGIITFSKVIDFKPW